MPLKVGDRIVGVLDVQSTQAYAFAEENLRTLQILADQLAIAVVNTELFAETQEHLAQHRLLHHITTTAASGTTLDEALQSAVNGLQVTLGGDRVSILLADREKKVLEVKAAVGYASNVFDLRIPLGSGITGWVAAHRRTLRINNVLQDTRYIEGSPNTRSEMAIPLLYRSELLGVLNVESEQFSAYAENDEELLGTLGGSLAAIIANARLLEQIRAQAERERILVRDLRQNPPHHGHGNHPGNNCQRTDTCGWRDRCPDQVGRCHHPAKIRRAGQTMIKRFSPNQMLHQIGGWYLTILIGVAQIISLLGAIPGILSIRANVEFERTAGTNVFHPCSLSDHYHHCSSSWHQPAGSHPRP